MLPFANRLAFAGLLLGISVLGAWALAESGQSDPGETGEDELPTLESLEERASMERPELSLSPRLTVVNVAQPGDFFVPPRLQDIPNTPHGDEIRYGRNIFINTQQYAKRYVGNGLNCSNCHLQEGRKPNAAPLWAAYPMYPMYRSKNKQVITFQERLQDCFRFSINGLAPTLDSREIEALTAYAQWLATGVPMGTALPGRGFNRIDKSDDPSPYNGEVLYKRHCALCHGDDTLGRKFTDRPGYMFPPLSGPDSYNKGAGMHKVKTCASFVQANMPIGKTNVLTDDEALEVCVHVWMLDRPWDPRQSWFMSLFLPITDG